MKKIIIWGTGKDYDQYICHIELEKYKGNLEIIGVTSNDTWLSNIGGYPVISKKKIIETSYDYIVVTSMKFFGEICREALLYGINRNKILSGEVFKIPYFDFGRYIQVKESNLTIISNHCWGGIIYNLLQIPFTSPFINTLLDDENYLRLIKNLHEYLKYPLEEVKDKKRSSAPCGRLGDVEIQFIHHSSFKLAKSDWDKRILRVNYNNIFLEMTVGNSEDSIKKFLENPYNKKVAFCSYPCEMENSAYVKDWESEKLRARYSYMFGIYVLDMIKKSYKSSHPLDILKLLLGEKGFLMKY